MTLNVVFVMLFWGASELLLQSTKQVAPIQPNTVLQHTNSGIDQPEVLQHIWT